MPVTRAAKAEKLKNYAIHLLEAFDKQQARVRERCATHDIKQTEALCSLGRGGFGEVFKVRKEGEEVAVKVQKKAKFSKYLIQYVVREKDFLFTMDSVFICKALAKWRDAEALYLYLELAIYGDLRRLMIRLRLIPESKAVNFTSQLVCALEYVHACRVLFRDLKPGNVLVFEGGRLKLGDFGLAIKSTPNINNFVGSHHYCAPEMYARHNYDDAVDWWALGCCIFEMTMGRRPFSNLNDPMKVVEENMKGEIKGLDEAPLSEAAKDMIRQLLERNPAKRIGTKQPGVQEIKNHEWFKEVDFYDVIFEDIQIADLGLEPTQGSRAVEPDHFRASRDETEDPDRHLWADF